MARKFNLDWLQSLNKKNVLHFKHDMSALLHHFIAAFSFKYILRLCFSESHFCLCSQAESAVAHMGELSRLKNEFMSFTIAYVKLEYIKTVS